jgi:hypothetical protein
MREFRWSNPQSQNGHSPLSSSPWLYESSPPKNRAPERFFQFALGRQCFCLSHISTLRIIIPPANDADMLRLNPVQMITDTYQFRSDTALQSLNRRFGARQTLLAIAVPDETSIKTMVRLFGGESEFTVSDDFAKEESTEYFDNAVKSILPRIEGNQQLQQVSLANASRLEVTIPIENLQNWLLIERRLSSMETVRSIKVKEISSRQALVELSVSKSQEQLGPPPSTRRRGSLAA